MAKFKDTSGREWSLDKVTKRKVDSLATMGMDLRLMLDGDSGELFKALANDVLVADAIWFLCETEAKARGVTKEDLTDFDHAALVSAREALQEAFLSFSLDPTIARQAIEKGRVSRERAIMEQMLTNGAGVSPESPASIPTT